MVKLHDLSLELFESFVEESQGDPKNEGVNPLSRQLGAYAFNYQTLQGCVLLGRWTVKDVCSCSRVKYCMMEDHVVRFCFTCLLSLPRPWPVSVKLFNGIQ